MMFGVVGILNLIQMSHVVPSTFDALHMPKVDFSGRIVRHELPPSEPACEMFAYWPKRCQPQIIPGTGLRMNRTAPGQALRGSKVCDHGGELWSMDACRAFVGIGDDWTAPCGFAGLGCRPMCYKVNVDECNALARNTSTATAAMTTEGALFRYANSTSFLNPWAPGQPSRMNPYLFTVGGSPSTGQAFAVLDLRPVDQLRQCEEYCNRWTPSGDCRAYVVQAPSKDYGMSMKCTLLGMRAVAGEEPVIKDYREILGDGRNGLADDDRWAPFVVAVRNSVFA